MNSSSAWNICVSGFEVYGELTSPDAAGGAEKKEVIELSEMKQYTVIMDLMLPKLPEIRQALFTSAHAYRHSDSDKDAFSIDATDVPVDAFIGSSGAGGGGGGGGGGGLEDDSEDEDEDDIDRRPKLDLSKHAFAEVFVRSDGKVGVGTGSALGKFGGSNTALMMPGKWHRIVITCDMNKGFFIVYVDGETALTTNFADSSAKSPFNLGRYFTVLGDAEPSRKYSLRAYLAAVQVRAFSVNQSLARKLGVAGQTLLGLDYLRKMTKFLSKMGYRQGWCIKSLNKCGGNEVLASDWIIVNRAALEEDDRLRQLRIDAAKLSLMGYPVTWCMYALEKNKSDIYTATQWLLDKNVEGKTADDSMFKLKEEEQADIKQVLATRLQDIEIESKAKENSLFRVLESTSEPIDIGIDTLVKREDPKQVTNFSSIKRIRSIREIINHLKLANDNLACVYSRRCVLAVLENWAESEFSKFTPFVSDVLSKTPALSKDFSTSSEGGKKKSRDLSPVRGEKLSSTSQAVLSKWVVTKELIEADPYKAMGIFLQLVEFSALSGGLDILKKAVVDALKTEKKAVMKLKREKVSKELLERQAPVTRAMVCQSNYHLVQICQNPRASVDACREEAEIHKKWNAALVVWIVTIFIDVMMENEDDLSRNNWFAEYLLSQELVNLIFESISMISGSKQLSFVRLLSALIRLNVKFDSKTSATLKGLMNRQFVVQEPLRKFTTFMQALIELMLAVEQIELRDLDQQEEIKVPKQIPALSPAPSVGTDEKGSIMDPEKKEVGAGIRRRMLFEYQV